MTAGPVIVITRSWMPAAVGQQAADLGGRGHVDAQRVHVQRQESPSGTSRPEQRRDQHLLGALRVLDGSNSTEAADRAGRPLRRCSAASGLLASTPTMHAPAPVTRNR